MKKIICDAEAADEAMRNRWERFESLSCHIDTGIRDGIAEHNKNEVGGGFLPATPEEISQSLAHAVASFLRSDNAAIERLIEDLHLASSDERFDTL
jgi:hypothetical protein